MFMSHPNTKRPLIGLVSSRDGERKLINQRYLDAVWQAGGLAVVLSYTTDAAKLSEYAEIFDGFLFSGGVDLDPAKYGEEKQFDSVEIDAVRDGFEEAIFKAIYPTGKPILGICRGIQSINVWLGGTLHQHIDGHRQSGEGEDRTHEIRIREGSMLHSLCGKTSVMVNTFHHQAVKTPAPALTVDAVSPDGFIEAAHQEGHRFLFATQFHPEFYYQEADDDHSLAIFTAFVNACK
jgi:putative glutamine amidotransferase